MWCEASGTDPEDPGDLDDWREAVAEARSEAYGFYAEDGES